jgi:hypothetical protein
MHLSVCSVASRVLGWLVYQILGLLPLSEYSRENTALKKVLKGRFFFLAVV